MPTLKLNSSGPDVKALQQKLKDLGFDPNGVDGTFGPGTKAAVIAFQNSKGLQPDGMVGPGTMAALAAAGGDTAGGGASDDATDAPAGAGAATAGGQNVPNVSVNAVAKMFPGVPVKNIETNLPFVLKALADAGLADKDMILMALATIRAETGNFTPLSEFQSKFNTPPGGPPFSLYDHRKDLGNQGPPDGANFKGRGYIQLTGRSNFKVHGAAIGLGDQLIKKPTNLILPVSYWQVF
jgi:peptidoglycan hydrolase-like protein with peptidoglycan-binding domain